jgi:hypothetical protein
MINMELFNIITVSARPENICYIGNNILSQKKYWDGELLWHIIFDFENDLSLPDSLKNFLAENQSWIKFQFLQHPANKSSGGNHGKDHLIKNIDQGWIYQLDDDNELYPNFLEKISVLIKNNPEYNLFCFWQKDRYHPQEIKDLKAGVTDTAMYVFSVNTCKNIDYPLHYGGDGKFLELLINNNKNSVFLYKEPLCWYNKIKYMNMNLNELSKLAIKYGTDKFQRHRYTEIYFEIFGHLKDEKIKLLELGILNGDSLRMWREWFTNAEITGIDHKIEHINEIENVKIIKSNTQTINICKDLNYEQFDIIIDDADHHPYQQLLTLWNTWPLLKEGGLYIIEDIQNINTWSKHWEFLKPKIYNQSKNGGTYDSVIFVFKK